MPSKRIRLPQRRLLHAGGFWVTGKVSASFVAPGSSDLAEQCVRASVTSTPVVVAAAMYIGALDLLLLTSWMPAGGGRSRPILKLGYSRFARRY